MAEVYWGGELGYRVTGDAGGYQPSAAAVKRIAAAFSDPEQRRREFPWLTDEIAAAVAAFDWPAMREPLPDIEDLTVDCACGEEAEIVPYADTEWTEHDWAGGVQYRCAACGRTWRVRVTVEAVP